MQTNLKQNEVFPYIKKTQYSRSQKFIWLKTKLDSIIIRNTKTLKNLHWRIM